MALRFFLRFLLISGLAAWVGACTGTSPTTGLFRPTSPHDQYGQSLKAAKLDQTALGSDWLAAGERALRDSLRITVPYRESGYFPANKAVAVGYRIDAQRGDRLLVQVEIQGQKSTRVFIDVLALEGRSRTTLVAASTADTNVLAWEPRRTQTYLIRLQPELLRSGRYTLSVTREPALSFPVQSRDSRQISSFFGVPRDGGRRRHEGVDIFAPRGTPAIAAVDGIVTGVGTNRLGGNVAFVSDPDRDLRVYYAHLDRWNVRNGQRVSVGDTIGFVGNTGNARTTGPHLHFGIYDNGGATDPLPFIRLGRGPARQILLEAGRLGDSLRVAVGQTALRSAPTASAPSLRQLTKSSALTVVGGTAAWLRVELPDGLTGYVASAATEAAKQPLRTLQLPAPGDLLEAASPVAAPIDRLSAGSVIAVLAGAERFLLVRRPDGQTGWLSAESVVAPGQPRR